MYNLYASSEVSCKKFSIIGWAVLWSKGVCTKSIPSIPHDGLEATLIYKHFQPNHISKGVGTWHCYYIELPVCTALACMYREMGYMHPRYMQFLNIIQLYNTLLEMGENWISKQVLYWDMNQPAGWMQAFRERCLEYRLLDPLRFWYPFPVDLAYGKCMCQQHQEKLRQEEMTNQN